MFRSRHAKSASCIAASLTALILMSPQMTTEVVAKNWTNGIGNGLWNVNGNWSPTGVPVTNEAVNIVFTDGIPRTVTLNVSPPSLGLLSIDLTGAGTDVSALSMPSNFNLAANGILVGGYNGSTTTAGRGAMTQSVGTVSTNSGWDFVLGYGANSAGTYSLSGLGALTANQSEYIGLFGNGTFNQSAGTNTVATATGFFILGTNSGSNGTYNLSGTGTLTVNTSERIGDIGIGAFNQTGGTHNLGGTLYLGYNASGAGGAYTLNSGTLTWFNSSATGAEHVGYAGTGTFTQNGGLNSVWGTGLHIGTLANSTGVYNLNAGDMGSNGGEYIGDSGTGILTQIAGTNGNGAGTDVFIGYNAGSNGTYNLGGTGSFGCGHDLYLGYNGLGTFHQTGGTVSVSENFVLGFGAGAVGSTYTLTAGSFSQGFASYAASIANGTFSQSGGTSSFSGGGVNVNGGSGSAGNFTVSGGTATTSYMAVASNGVLTVSGSGVLTLTGNLSATSGTPNVINLSGGTINTPALNFYGTPAALNWTSGTLHMTQTVRWNNSANPTATADAFGFGRALGSNQTLAVTGDEYLGGDVPFVLTLNAGSAHNVSGTLVIDVTGTITQNAGSTLNANAIVQGGGTVNGTLQNQGTFTYQSGSFNGRLLNQGTANLGSTFTAGNGVENDSSMTVSLGQTLTLNGAGLDNQGNFTMAGGTLNGGGPLVNNSVLTGRGTLAGAGGITNNGYLAPSGGTLTLNNIGTNSNGGQIDISAGQQLQLNGGSLTNTGAISLIGGTLGGTAVLNNSTGIISGHGTISSPLINAGLLAVDSGILNVNTAFNNNGEVYLAGGVATLSGSGAISNAGLVRGDGVVNKPVNNVALGEIRAESGKQIKLTGANGNNVGLINLQGGTAEFSQPLFNGGTGQIVGRGTLKVGGTGLQNNGNVDLSAGITDVFGVVRNTSGVANKGITISGNANATFWGDVTNNAGSLFKVSSGSSVTFFGPFHGAGISGTGSTYFESDVTPGFSPANVNFDGSVFFGDQARLVIELGGRTPGSQYDQVHIAGPLSLGGTLEVDLIDLGAGVFTPTNDGSFDILDWGSLSGTFSSIQLPTLANGLQWNTSQLYTTGVLSIDVAGIAGDFNHNGVVDAADYVGWRKGLGTTYTQNDYNSWRENFGQTAGSGAGIGSALLDSAVPEPASFAIAALGFLGLVVITRRRNNGVNRLWSSFSACHTAAAFTVFFLLPSTKDNTAVAKSWNDGTANWSPGVWSPAGVPITNEAVNIVFSDGAARTVTLNVSSPSLGLMTVDLTGPGATASELSMPDNNTLTAKGLLIGGYNGITATQTAGRGVMTQSAGTTTVGSADFALGYGANSTGTYTLNGAGALVANNSEYIGIGGKGTFNQSAGTNTIANSTGFFEIGEVAGSTGTYNLSGTGTLTVNTTENVGDVGKGIFNQTGGTHTINGAGHNLNIGNGLSGYTLSAGSLSVSSGVENILGNFVQSGGTNTAGNLYVDLSYSLIGGTLTSNSSEYVIESGTLGQTGGVNNVAGTLYVGDAEPATYILGGTGSLSTVDETIGGTGLGSTMNQTGGTHTVTGNLRIGDADNTYNYFNLSAGQASIGSVFVGSSAGAVGVLTVSGTGVLTVGGALKVYSTSFPPDGPNTSLNLAGGTINAAALDFGGTTSLLNWTSGTLNLTQSVTWDSAGATSTSIAFGSALALGDNRTLMVSGDETLGGTGAFDLTLNSGSTHTVTGGITIAPKGALALSGGTLNADHIVNNGNFAFFSGVLHITGTNGLTIGAGGPLGSTVLLSTAQTLNVTNTVTINSGAYLAVAGGFNAGNLANNGDLVVINTAIGGPVVNNHAVTVVGTVNFNGLVSGPGGFFGPGTAHFNGGLAPGASPANVSFEGGLALADTNRLFIEIGGITPGSQYDRLTIAGSASLDGSLDVSLINGFTPLAGQEFIILTASSIVNDGLVLTGSMASSFNLLVNSNSVVLQAIGLAGDFNHNGVVDAADYVGWRKGLGTTYTQDDYNRWRENFGQTAGSGAALPSATSLSAAVPEPPTSILLFAAAANMLVRRTPHKVKSLLN